MGDTLQLAGNEEMARDLAHGLQNLTVQNRWPMPGNLAVDHESPILPEF
jgi:hypothetical protein